MSRRIETSGKQPGSGGSRERAADCESRIETLLEDRLADLRHLRDTDCSLADYGLSFDYVPPFTFADQPEGYFRYQLSWGGPSDEFRFFINPDLTCHRIEYWFLDWFDCASRTLSGDEAELLADIWDWFCGTGIVQSAYAKAQAP